MSKFNITSSTLNSSFTYENENLSINGSFIQDAKTAELQNISGTAYKSNGEGQQGTYVGNFNGRMVNGVMKYAFSDMTLQDTMLVLDAIDDIEKYINGENQE